MNTNKAFKLAANRVEKYLAEVGIEINPKQAVALVCQYAGHGPWAVLDFKKAVRSVENQLVALGVGQLPHTQALELVARIEGVKSWNVLTKHIAPGVTYGAEVLDARALATIRDVAKKAASSAPVGFGEQVRATGVLIATANKSLQSLETKIGGESLSGADVEAQHERVLAHVLWAANLEYTVWAAKAEVQGALAGAGEPVLATGVRTAAVYSTLQTLEAEIGSSAQCVNVEFDTEFCGGNYTGVGDFVAVPLVLVDLAKGSVESAFTVLTGLSAQHVVHYTRDEVVNQVGEPFYEPEGRAPLDSEADSLPLMWIRKDRPLSEAELQAHTGNGERYVKVVLDVDWDLLGRIDDLNDEVSERIAGSCCDLQDIGYQNHFPTDKERQQFGEPEPRTVWIEVNADWSPCD